MASLNYMLRSAVGMAHVLWSRLVMNYTTSYFPLIVLGYPLDSKRSSLVDEFRVRFGESLIVRLYSEIGHIHLRIEAQCVTTLLSLGDCHTTHQGANL